MSLFDRVRRGRGIEIGIGVGRIGILSTTRSKEGRLCRVVIRLGRFPYRAGARAGWHGHGEKGLVGQ